MDNRVICDVCRKAFTVNDICIEEDTVKRAGELRAVIVQYFRCPECGYKYMISVQDNDIKQLSKEYQAFMMDCALKQKEGIRLQKISLKARGMKKRIMAEEAILLHAYQKQHKEG